jgi:hypothetical protein
MEAEKMRLRNKILTVAGGLALTAIVAYTPINCAKDILEEKVEHTLVKTQIGQDSVFITKTNRNRESIPFNIYVKQPDGKIYGFIFDDKGNIYGRVDPNTGHISTVFNQVNYKQDNLVTAINYLRSINPKLE